MVLRVAINGFGRIGRLFFRLAAGSDQIQIVAINDLVPADNLAYLLKYDSIHRQFKATISTSGDTMTVDGQTIHMLAEKDPKKLPWKTFNIDYVIESTGLFCDKESAKKHLEAGAKRVIITAPAKGHVPTYVIGVNHHQYNPEKDVIVSNASCTTNCLAPLAKVLLDNFGIEEGLMTTVHAVTASQPSVDGPSKKDWRGGRAASLNIIPASTGAARATAECLPELEGKLTGMAFRVPVGDVSVVDLTVRLSRPTSYAEVFEAFSKASEGELKGILCVSDEELVSSDLIGSTESCIVDKRAGIELNKTFYKFVAWYDNEWAYACRVFDLMTYMASKELKISC